MASIDRPRDIDNEALERRRRTGGVENRGEAARDHKNRYEDFSTDANGLPENEAAKIGEILAIQDVDERVKAAQERLGLFTNGRDGKDLERLRSADLAIARALPLLRERRIHAVLDGVSGGEHGVSNGSGLLGGRLAAEGVSEVLTDPETEKKFSSTEDVFEAALTRAHESLIGYRGDRRDLREMAATIVLAKIEQDANGNPELVLGTLGDAPAYVFDGPPGKERLIRVSADESALGKELAAGRLTPEDYEAVQTKPKDKLTGLQPIYRRLKGQLGNGLGHDQFSLRKGGPENINTIEDSVTAAVKRPNIRRITGLSERAKVILASDGIEKIPQDELAERIRSGDLDGILRRAQETKDDDATFTVIEVGARQEATEQLDTRVTGPGIESTRLGRTSRELLIQKLEQDAEKLATIEGGIELPLKGLEGSDVYDTLRDAKNEVRRQLVEHRSILAKTIAGLEAQSDLDAEEQAELEESKAEFTRALRKTAELNQEVTEADEERKRFFRAQLRPEKAPEEEPDDSRASFEDLERRAIEASGEAESARGEEDEPDAAERPSSPSRPSGGARRAPPPEI